MTGATAALPGVVTWYREKGSGDPLVYLHGGFSSSREIEPVEDAYAERFHVFAPDRRGHGRTADVEGPYTYEAFAEDTAAFLDQVVGGPAHLVGFSDGATTALHLALARPDLVRRLVLISGQYHQNGLMPSPLDGPDALDGLVDSPIGAAHAAESPDGPDHFRVVAAKVLELARTRPLLAVEQLAGVRARTLVMTADDDAVRLEHTLELYRGIPDSELAVVPGTSHVLIMEKPDTVARTVLDFLSTEPVPTIMPIRRA